MKRVGATGKTGCKRGRLLENHCWLTVWLQQPYGDIPNNRIGSLSKRRGNMGGDTITIGEKVKFVLGI